MLKLYEVANFVMITKQNKSSMFEPVISGVLWAFVNY